MTEDEKWRKAHEEFMQCRDVLKFDRTVYSRSELRRFVAHIRKTGFYSHHSSDGRVTLIFKSPEQKTKLMAELRLATKVWQKQVDNRTK